MQDLLVWGLVLLTLSAGLLVIEIFVPTAGALAVMAMSAALSTLAMYRLSRLHPR